MPTGGQKQEEVERQSAGRGQAGEKARRDKQTDQDLGDRDPDPRQGRMGNCKRAQDEAARRGAGKSMQLGADICRRPRMQETRDA